MNHPLRVQLQNGAGGCTRPETENSDGSGRQNGRQGGEDVKVSVGEVLEDERDAVDVSGDIKKEKS